MKNNNIESEMSIHYEPFNSKQRLESRSQIKPNFGRAKMTAKTKTKTKLRDHFDATAPAGTCSTNVRRAYWSRPAKRTEWSDERPFAMNYDQSVSFASFVCDFCAKIAQNFDSSARFALRQEGSQIQRGVLQVE